MVWLVSCLAPSASLADARLLPWSVGTARAATGLAGSGSSVVLVLLRLLLMLVFLPGAFAQREVQLDLLGLAVSCLGPSASLVGARLLPWSVGTA